MPAIGSVGGGGLGIGRDDDTVFVAQLLPEQQSRAVQQPMGGWLQPPSNPPSNPLSGGMSWHWLFGSQK